ncbi:NAD(P)/FAD-dependent oxidoreductase [Actinoplanes sp. NPDC049599]|uniref:NAD(P)/FAD-dependent oxidoreductase n=1 Tax=Actinoplanes sp. NPDC049599 TaxID=3363903 RepID=UPI0037AE9C07
MTRAVVLGGGFAGVLAANVLARHTGDVVLIEGARYPQRPGPRSGLPQAFHSHLLVTAGARALDTLLPGVVDMLLAGGAHRRGLPGDSLIRSAEGWFRRYDTGAYLISCSRWLTDWVVRRRALAGRAVRVCQGTQVIGLTGDPARVSGVVVRDAGGGVTTLPADLVVDATGRRSRAGHWLAGLGAAGVDEVSIDPHLAYATRMYRAPGDADPATPAVMIHPDPAAALPTGGTLFPIEDGRWMVTLVGPRPPRDPAGFTARAYGLSSPVIAELIARAEPVGDLRPFRGTVNRRRFYERGPRPDGLVVLGDALMAVNPVYSHGMSVAAMSALRLAAELDRHGTDAAVAPLLQTAMAQESERSWQLATGPGGPGTTGGAGPARELIARATLTSPRLMTDLFRAQTLLAPAAHRPPAGGGPPLSAGEAIAQFPELAASVTGERTFR